eukprot:6111369-Pleurochrysis_carterae.AAC.3
MEDDKPDCLCSYATCLRPSGFACGASPEQVNYYNSSLAFTEGGNMVLRSINQDVVLPNYNFSKDSVPETRHLQTAMVQSWNKFCFQEGIAEVRVKLNGLYDQAGLWPAFWLMGNLGRATFKDSTEGLWPFIFDQCVPPEDPNCRAN